MVCICRWSGRGRVEFGGTACAMPGALAGAAGKAVAFAPNDCSRPPESKRVPPDALARPETKQIALAALGYCASATPESPDIVISRGHSRLRCQSLRQRNAPTRFLGAFPQHSGPAVGGI